jgi:hypothetical protein
LPSETQGFMMRAVEGDGSSSHAAIRRVRDTLESGIGADQARAVLFDALTQWGWEIPGSRVELNDFVHGPLRRLLAQYTGSSDTLRFMLDLENALAVVDSSDSKRPSVFPPSAPQEANAASTWTMKPIPGPAVRVLCVSSRESIGRMLELALGRDLVSPRLATPLSTIAHAITHDSDVVVVDGVSPPTIGPLELARLLTKASIDVWLAIWGAEEPYGQEVASVLLAADVHCVPIPRKEGIAPFIDLVRARKG